MPLAINELTLAWLTAQVAYWTDMRNDATFAGITRKGEDAYFARAG